jgi:copper resistance protein B
VSRSALLALCGAALAAAPAGAQTAPPPGDHAADLFYGQPAMDQARAILGEEHGGMRMSKVMLNIAEYQAGAGGGYRWDGEAWYGGDLDRLVLKSEGEGRTRSGLESAEVQALYSRAIGPYTDLQLGLRQDLAPVGRAYATAGVETLLPYWIEAGAALFLSDRGELLGRAEAYYDLRLTQRLVLQPRAELDFAAQDTPQTRTGAGLSNAELGLRLRYEIRHELAPYVGVTYDAAAGRTAGYLRAAGEAPRRASVVIGLRAWF